MKNLIEEIDILKRELKEKQTQYSDVYNQILEECKDSYFKFEGKIKNDFRFALMLTLGEYKKYYDSEVVRNLRIEPVKDWDTKDYKNHYQILLANSWKYGWAESYKNGGFICYKKDLYYALAPKMRELWLVAIKEKRYLGSLLEFKHECGKNIDYLIEVFEGYHERRDFNFITFTNKKLSIKDVIIYIEKDFNKF